MAAVLRATARRPATLAAFTLVGGAGAALAMRPVYADEKPVAAPKRKPLYDQPDAPTLLEPVAVPFQGEVSMVRKHAVMGWDKVKESVNKGVEKVVGFEVDVEKEVKHIVPKDEQLTPGLLYIGVATLTGSILTRNRIFLLRWTVPPAFLVGSFAFFLPKTAHNVNSYLAARSEGYKQAVEAAQEGYKSAESSYAGARSWVAEKTGK